MARGDRFKRRLPPFIRKIPDFDDLFIAEDQEFTLADINLKDMGYSLNAHTIPLMKHPEGDLARFEKDYGLTKKGTIDDRVKAILRKIRLQEPTTVEVILKICESHGFQAVFEERYKDYGFTIWLYNPKEFDGSLTEVIDEAKPAHLEQVIAFVFHYKLELNTRQGDYSYPLWKCGEHKTGMLPRPVFKGEREIIHLDLETGEYTGKDYKYWKGIKAGDRVFSQSDDIVLRQLSPLDRGFKDAKVYELEEE